MPAAPGWQAAKGGCFVVADGVGGHRHGALASRLAGETVLTSYFRSPMTNMVAALGASILAANQRVSDFAASDPSFRGMASTVVAVAVRGADAVVAHVGDSRAYLLRHRMLYTLTRDHSWVQEMVDSGVITPGDAAHHPYRHIVTRYAGMGRSAMPDVRELKLVPGDALLLCSDGISDRVPSREMGSVLNGPTVLNPACALTYRAAALGSRDNASAIVIRYLPWSAPQMNASRAGMQSERSATDEALAALIFGGALMLGAGISGVLLAGLLK